jgi:hypothetical protein
MLAMRMRESECRAGEENTMTIWNRDGAGALVFWIVSVASGLCARTVGLWRRCGGAVAAWISIGAVGCGGTGNTGPSGAPDASNDVLRGSEASVTLDSSSQDASQDATTDSGESDTIPGACAVYAKGFCSTYLSCEAFTFESIYGSVATCEQRVEQFCPDNFAAPGTGVTPSSLAACGLGISNQTCAQALTEYAPGCVWHGSESMGASCEYDAQCQSGFCEVASGSVCGTCQPLVSLGQACDSAYDCANGLICATTSCPVDGGACTGTEQAICFDPRGAGSVCDTPTDCESPLGCVKGVCASLLENGAPCDGGGCDTLAALYCAAKLEGGAQTCVQATFAPAGAPCNSTTSPPTLCAASGSCRSTTGEAAVVGTCVAAAADGQSCANALCMPPAICVSGICQAPVPASSCN